MSTPTTYEEFASQHYLDKVNAVAERLRHIADEVELIGVDVARSTTRNLGGHTNAAQRVVHAVTWGIANADLPGLIANAGEADRAASDALAEKGTES